MAKRRSWHFYTFIVSFTAVLIGYLLWNFSPVKNEVKAVLIKKLQPYLGDSFLINDFAIGFYAISFYKVRAAGEGSTFALDLEEIRIGVNLFKLFSRQPKLTSAIEYVSIYSPQLTLYYSEEKDLNDRNLALDKVLEEIITNTKKFPEINYVSIIDGGVHLQMQGGKQLPLLNKLDGRVTYLANSEKVEINLEGEFLGAPNSLINFDGYVDFGKKSWDANLLLDECIITSKWPFWKLNFWQLENARLEGAVKITSNSFEIDSLIFKGSIIVNDFASHIFKQYSQASKFILNFNKRAVTIEPFDVEIEDGNGIFSGTIPDIFDPQADWELILSGFSANNLIQSHSIFEYAYKGKIAGRAFFKGPFKNLTVTAKVSSPDLLYAVVPFNTNSVNLEYNTKSKILKFTDIQAYFMKFRTQGIGQVDFNTHLIHLLLKSDIDVPQDYFTLLNGLNNGRILLDTELSGDYTTKLFGGTFEYRVERQDSLLSDGQGPFTLDDQLLKFDLYSNEIKDAFHTKGTIEELFSNPNFNILDIKAFPVHRFTENPLVSYLVKERYVNFYIAGPYNSLNTKMNVVAKNQPQNKFILSTNIRDIFFDNQKFKGNFTAYTGPKRLNGVFDVEYSLDGINTTINVPNVFSGKLFMGSMINSPFQGNIRLNNFSIKDFFSNSPSIIRIFEDGSLQGDMNISGTVQNPNVTFDLDIKDLIINKVGYYTTDLIGALKDHLLTINNFWVRLNSDSLINADFFWNLQTDSMNLTTHGENIESSFLAETIFKDPQIIQGDFSYKIVAQGLMSNPTVYADVEVGNGLFKGNPFHSISVTLEDSLFVGKDFWELENHAIKIRKFLYTHPEEYAVECHGLISIDQDKPIDLMINVTGNVFAELPQIIPYFQNPKCQGNLFAQIKGTISNFYFDNFWLKIVNGSMEFDGVIPPVKDLNIDIRLKSDSSFVNINTVEGMVNGSWARIYNLENVVAGGKKMEPWVFEDFGLNFGVLVLETAEHGIPLSIYGMMEEGDYGHFAAVGKEPDEKFYFAGPANLPLARGKLVLHNCRVTFPFIGMYDDDGEFVYDEDDKVLNFLMNMAWDVTAIPGNSNRYFVDIPGYVGSVYMDLNIDNSSEGLTFTGRWIDDSFRLEGGVNSSRGRVEYLDVNFRVERFGAEFSTYEIFPEVYGRAYTTVRVEQYQKLSEVGQSPGNNGASNDLASQASVAATEEQSQPLDIYLVLYVIDPVTKKEIVKGRWEDFRFKLATFDKIYGNTQEDLLAHLGYSFENLQYKAGELGLTMTENYLIRPLFRPIERQLERRLKLDYVRLRSNFTSNLFYLSFQDRAKLFNRPTFLNPNISNNSDPALVLLQSSEITMGKYLLKDVYLTYTGQVVSGFESSSLGLNHTWGLEYRLLYNLLFEMELSRFQFNPFHNEDFRDEFSKDFRIRIRHSFNF